MSFGGGGGCSLAVEFWEVEWIEPKMDLSGFVVPWGPSLSTFAVNCSTSLWISAMPAWIGFRRWLLFSVGRILENLAMLPLISGSSVRKLRHCSFCAAENFLCSSLRSSQTLDRRVKWRSSSDQSVSSSISSSGPYGDPAPGASTYLIGIIW